jgi:cysteine-rich repeat protein
LLCGNGVRFGIEQCDDGNVTDFDGCSSTCTVEPGYECAGVSPDSCTKLCGNGIVNFGEECDDGNTKSGDGCSDCVVDRGWVC